MDMETANIVYVYAPLSVSRLNCDGIDNLI